MPQHVHQIRISLRDSKPPIWRRVAVPSDITLGQLHEVIQIAMGWTDSHLHHFKLQDKSLINRDPEVIARLTKEGRYDEIFTASRGIRVFVASTTPFGDPTEMDGEDEDAVTLGEVSPKVRSKLIYEYDFGDGWEHIIEVRKIAPGSTKPDEARPRCLAGKMACPPEDCGGIYGYYRMLEIAADPEHEEHEDIVEWLGDDFDSEKFDIDEVNEMLAQWRAS
ncbi:MAG: plasmid pRiA4b ORF-3 family protein [Phycisphaeraceae bacterium]|nr:plasmid pRiA4b ORF-3 family protein [Phycisphaeraceae bacterium]